MNDAGWAGLAVALAWLLWTGRPAPIAVLSAAPADRPELGEPSRLVGRRRSGPRSPGIDDVVAAVGQLAAGLRAGASADEVTGRLARSGNPWLAAAVAVAAAEGQSGAPAAGQARPGDTEGATVGRWVGAEGSASVDASRVVNAADVWRAVADAGGSRRRDAGLVDALVLRVAAVLDLAHEHGAPAEAGLQAALRATAAQRAADRARGQAVAGARATAVLLVLLPLLGPVVVVGLGLDPVATYVTNPVGRGSVLAGLAFTALGGIWLSLLVRRAARPAVAAAARAEGRMVHEAVVPRQPAPLRRAPERWPSAREGAVPGPPTPGQPGLGHRGLAQPSRVPRSHGRGSTGAAEASP